MNRFQFSGFGRVTPVVLNLIIINVLFFLTDIVFQTKGIELSKLLGGYYFDSPEFKPWQVITYMFMHGGWEHIFFNMFGLYMFGSILENVWGPKRFLYFYFLCGIGAILFQWAVQALEVHSMTGYFVYHEGLSVVLSESDKDALSAIYYAPIVGASGAIFGLLLAFGMSFPETELYLFFIPIPVKAKYFVGLYICMELFLGIKQNPGDSVAHFAHLGGALVGFIIIRIWNRGRPSRIY